MATQPLEADIAQAQPLKLHEGGFARVRMLGRVSGRIRRALSRETSSGRFIPEMDGLRFVAISLVILFHLNGYLLVKTSFYERGITKDWLCNLALTGFHGVELFFVISGFILALPFAAHHLNGAPAVSLRKYYLRRLTRLEPPYFVSIFLMLALGALAHKGTASAVYSHLAASLFYLHNLIYAAPSTVLGVAWSLEIEVQFYLLVPLLTLIFAIRRTELRRALLIGLVLATLAGQQFFLPQHARLSLSILAYLQFFLAGFLLADVYLATWKSDPRRHFYWDGLALAGWVLLFGALQARDVVGHWFFPALVFLVYCASFRGRWTNRFLSNGWITAIGGMCYSIYLIHYEVISAVARRSKTLGAHLPYPVYLAAQFVMVSSVIVLVCGVYFIILEKPCMRRDWPLRAWQRVRALRAEPSRPRTSFAD